MPGATDLEVMVLQKRSGHSMEILILARYDFSEVALSGKLRLKLGQKKKEK